MSVLARARNIVASEDTGIRVFFNTLQTSPGKDLSDVNMLETLYARFGLPSSINSHEPSQRARFLIASPRGSQEEALVTDVKVLEVQTDPKDQLAPYGKVVPGRIIIRGLTLHLCHAQQPKLCRYIGSVVFDEPKFDDKRPTARSIEAYYSNPFIAY